MKKTKFNRNFGLMVVVAALVLSGCAVGFHKRSPKDVEKIKVLSEQLEELRRAKAQLEQQLRREIAKGEVSVEMQERGLVLTLIDSVLFDSGKAKVRPQGKEVLQKVANVLSSVDNKIAIEGHTDNVPIKFSGWKSNWELSSHRALNVLHYFVDEEGLNPAQFSATGYGPYSPVASNDTPEGRQQNRRVEIVILSGEVAKKAVSPDEVTSGELEYIK